MNTPKINYQLELEKVLKQLKKTQEETGNDTPPTLLLHACCAPCSSYCLEYLSDYFDITVFFYNPNIYPAVEYEKRVEEIRRFIRELPMKYPVKLIEGIYDPENFYRMAKGLEEVREGGSRCFKCYEQRLRKTAELAAEKGFDYFTTTLTISPLKNAQKLNEIGSKLADEFEKEEGGLKPTTMWLPSDFKKKNGYKRSVELSAEYKLYRQNYCGCEFSQKMTLQNS